MEGTDPAPLPATAKAEAEPGLPLALYRSLKTKIDAAQNPATAEMAAALRDEVRAHEPELRAALRAPQSIQRRLAASALCYAAECKQAVEGLCAALRDDEDSAVRAASAAALGCLCDAAAVETLIGALRDESEEVRGSSAAALGLLRDERAVPGLLRLLRTDEKPLLRAQAAMALAQIRTDVREQDLASALAQESDERVKMTIAAAIKALSGEELLLDGIPDPNDYHRKLSALSRDMGDVELKLRDDRHDETVQIDQQDIERKLNDLISELEKTAQASQSQGLNARERERLERRAALGATQPQGQSTRPGSKPVRGTGGTGALVPSSVTGRHEKWASLPNKERDELLQVYRPEIPLRWRRRLEAYFLSVAAEEAKALLKNEQKKQEERPEPSR